MENKQQQFWAMVCFLACSKYLFQKIQVYICNKATEEEEENEKKKKIKMT